MKWLKDQRNVRVRDLMLILEENLPRNKWTDLGRVTEVGRDIQECDPLRLRLLTTELHRPVVKLCLLDF